MHLAEGLRRSAAERPDGLALVDADGRWSYAELDDAVDRATAVLAQAGVGPGERVGLLADNGAAFVVSLYSAWLAGAAVLPLHAEATAEECRGLLTHAEAAAFVVTPERRGAVEPGLPEGTRRIEVSGARMDVEGVAARDEADRWRRPGADESDGADDDGACGEAEGEGAQQGGRPADVAGPESDLALLCPTAGTSGRPRLAMLTHGQLSANHRQLAATRLAIGPGDVVLGALPMSHAFGLNVGLCYPLAAGAAVRCVARFDPEATLAAAEADGVTVLLGVPTMFAAWLAVAPGRFELAGVRAAVSGAAPLEPDLAAGFAELLGVPIWEGYGLTEAAPVLTTTAMADAPRPGSVGLPLPEVRLRLVDDRDRPVPPGDPGEVLARGPNVFDGYWRDRAATERTLTPEGWLRTGDVAYVDERGELRLVDRKDDVIIVDGFNVYPREIEEVLAAHPAVAEAAVVAMPASEASITRPGAGVVPRAFVVPAGEQRPDEAELVEHCRARLAPYKRPRRVDVVDALPRLATGKLLRRELG